MFLKAENSYSEKRKVLLFIVDSLWPEECFKLSLILILGSSNLLSLQAQLLSQV